MQLVLLVLFLLPAILFLLTQQNTLKMIRPENRSFAPGLVWLQLIPIFNYVWIFIVVRRIADSLAREYAGWESDSIFGIADEEALKNIGKRPTYGIGLTYCILCACMPISVIFFNLIGSRDMTPENSVLFFPMGLTAFALILAVLVCWIIYWVQLAGWKRKLKQRAALAAA
jgi:hypothetical protein